MAHLPNIRLIPSLLLACFIGVACNPATPPATLDIYFIDVEGGQATLVVTPTRESLLIDVGFPGEGTFSSQPGDPAVARDPQRILDVARAAGITAIDNLFITHFHADHVGGVPELAQLLPIRRFIDHGGVTPDAERVAGTTAIHAAYAGVRGTNPHIEPRPGDVLPLSGLTATVVSSAGEVLSSPLPPGDGAANPGCLSGGVAAGETTENPRSTGLLLEFGQFRFLNVGDLSGPPLFDLTCPVDLIGPVDVYLVSHHGGADAADPALFTAIQPRVAVLNNGEHKGGAPATLATLESLSQTDTWQLHRSMAEGARNSADTRIANLDESAAHWIRIQASADGSFVVTNGRTGHQERYPARTR